MRDEITRKEAEQANQLLALEDQVAGKCFSAFLPFLASCFCVAFNPLTLLDSAGLFPQFRAAAEEVVPQARHAAGRPAVPCELYSSEELVDMILARLEATRGVFALFSTAVPPLLPRYGPTLSKGTSAAWPGSCGMPLRGTMNGGARLPVSALSCP